LIALVGLFLYLFDGVDVDRLADVFGVFREVIVEDLHKQVLCVRGIQLSTSGLIPGSRRCDGTSVRFDDGQARVVKLLDGVLRVALEAFEVRLGSGGGACLVCLYHVSSSVGVEDDSGHSLEDILA